MNIILKILHKPTLVFKQLDDFYEEDLDTNSNLIALIVGCLVGLHSCYAEFDNLKELASGFGLILVCILSVLLSAGVIVLIYNYILTYIFYLIGKALGSKGVVADTRTAIVYSLIPMTLSLVFLFIQGSLPESLTASKAIFWLTNGISLVIWLWSMTILVIGLKILNKYGVIKAIINILPLPIIGLIIILIRYM
ncbi:MAG: YIP1 family protein [Marinilabiliaceae bacterium]|nr:YIP1 family protein [Marinilabiliaceae bacterium]